MKYHFPLLYIRHPEISHFIPHLIPHHSILFHSTPLCSSVSSILFFFLLLLYLWHPSIFPHIVIVCSFLFLFCASVSSSIEWEQEWYLPHKDVCGLDEFSHVEHLEESLAIFCPIYTYTQLHIPYIYFNCTINTIYIYCLTVLVVYS